MDLEGKEVLVLGLGITGQSSARFCAERGAHVLVVDEGPGEAPDLGPGIEARTGAALPSGADFDLVVTSPGIPAARWRAVSPEAIGDVELASRFLRVPVVAVTGTNGKSTTVRLVEAMLRAVGLRAEAAGNLGTPVLALVGRPLDVAVIEVSSFQLEATTSLAPRVAVWLNTTPDHLDRHASLDAYADAKARLLRHQGPGDVAILSRDDAAACARAEACAARILWLSRGPVESGAWLEGDHAVIDADRRERVALPPLPPGVHPDCVLAALLGVHALGGDLEKAAGALVGFEGLPHRGECVAEVAGVRYLDDSKATNPGAAEAALRRQRQPVWWIAGGRDKGLDFAPLAEAAATRVRGALLIGEAAPQIARALAGRVPWEIAGDLETAIARAAERAAPGDVVLLSPACASFDQFQSYEDRGQRFRGAVAALATSGGPPSEAGPRGGKP